MKRIALIGCSSKKKTQPAKAGELYDSELFKLSLRFAEKLEPDEIYVLSAKYGLLPIDKVIRPYDKSLNEMSATSVKHWATYVLGQLAKVSDVRRDQYILLAGESYRKYLLPYLGSYTVPLEGKRIGEQIQFLQTMVGDPPAPTEAAADSSLIEPVMVKEQSIESAEQEQLQALLDFGKRVDPKELFPTKEPGAGEFVLGDPYAFAMATSLDRGTKAEIIWTIPFYIQRELGHLDPLRIQRMGTQELSDVIGRLPYRPRYVNAAPRTVNELTALVVNEFGGEADQIWKGKRAEEVKQTFRRVYGVGPGIASMAVLLLEKAYGFRFSDLDRTGMDIKPDVHTTRVLYRMGLSEAEDDTVAVATARRLHPAYPGEIDAPLWVIGRRWCNKWGPRCFECAVQEVCERRGV